MMQLRTIAVPIIAVVAIVSAPAKALDIVGSGLAGKLIGGTAQRYWTEWTGHSPAVAIGSEIEAAKAFCRGTGEDTPVLLAFDRKMTTEEAAVCRDNGIEAAVLLTLGRNDDAGSWKPVNVYIKSGHPRADQLERYLNLITSELTIGDHGDFRRFGLLPLKQPEREAVRAKAAALVPVPIVELAREIGDEPPSKSGSAKRSSLAIAGVAIGMTAEQAEAAPQGDGFTFKGRSKPPRAYFERPHESGAPEMLIVTYKEATDGALQVVAASRGVALNRPMLAHGVELDVSAFKREVLETYGEPYGCEGLSHPNFRCAYVDNPDAPYVLMIAQGHKTGVSVSLVEYNDRVHGTLPGAWTK